MKSREITFFFSWFQRDIQNKIHLVGVSKPSSAADSSCVVMKVIYSANILTQCVKYTLNGIFVVIPSSDLELSPPY